MYDTLGYPLAGEVSKDFDEMAVGEKGGTASTETATDLKGCSGIFDGTSFGGGVDWRLCFVQL